MAEHQLLGLLGRRGGFVLVRGVRQREQLADAILDRANHRTRVTLLEHRELPPRCHAPGRRVAARGRVTGADVNHSKVETYRDLGGDDFRERSPTAGTQRLIAGLEALGTKVTLEPTLHPAAVSVVAALVARTITVSSRGSPSRASSALRTYSEPTTC